MIKDYATKKVERMLGMSGPQLSWKPLESQESELTGVIAFYGDFMILVRNSSVDGELLWEIYLMSLFRVFGCGTCTGIHGGKVLARKRLMHVLETGWWNI